MGVHFLEVAIRSQQRKQAGPIPASIVVFIAPVDGSDVRQTASTEQREQPPGSNGAVPCFLVFLPLPPCRAEPRSGSEVGEGKEAAVFAQVVVRPQPTLAILHVPVGQRIGHRNHGVFLVDQRADGEAALVEVGERPQDRRPTTVEVREWEEVYAVFVGEPLRERRVADHPFHGFAATEHAHPQEQAHPQGEDSPCREDGVGDSRAVGHESFLEGPGGRGAASSLQGGCQERCLAG